MSRFIVNKGCEMCNKTETGLVEMTVGKIKHYLCYPCMAQFANDVKLYADMNLYETTDEYSNTRYTDKEETKK